MSQCIRVAKRRRVISQSKHYGSRDRKTKMINFLTIGTILGLSAGFAPGPLLALVISETLQHDIKSGVKVALAPIIIKWADTKQSDED